MMDLSLEFQTASSGLVAFVKLAFGDLSCIFQCWQCLQMLLSTGDKFSGFF